MMIAATACGEETNTRATLFTNANLAVTKKSNRRGAGSEFRREEAGQIIARGMMLFRAACIAAVLIAAMIQSAAAQTGEATIEAVDAQKLDPGQAGPSSVPAQALQDSTARTVGGIPSIPSLDDQRLILSADYNITAQYATESLGEDTAAGGVSRFYGHWTAYKSGTTDGGMLVFKVENRHSLGTDIAPQSLGFEAGFAGVPATTFSDQGTMLSNLYWAQGFDNHRLGFNAGVVDVTDYIDVYGQINIWTGFNNLVFATNPTIPAPSQGIGGVVHWMFTDNYYVTAGLADANGDPTKPGDFIDDFFDVGEYFKHVELGWIQSWGNRHSDNIHITLWDSDRREAAGVDSGSGVSVSFSRMLNDRWTYFVRAGKADGGGPVLERAISAGFGHALNTRGDFFGLGLNWGEPSPALTAGERVDQYIIEAYYRLQLLPQVAIIPGIQYVRNPALNPGTSDLWVPAMRFRMTF